MGFLNILEKGIKAGMGKAQKYKEDVEKYKMQYDRYDDRRLMELFKSSTGARKIACGLLLRERGYSQQ